MTTKTKRTIKCSRCQVPGHNARTCAIPRRTDVIRVSYSNGAAQEFEDLVEAETGVERKVIKSSFKVTVDEIVDEDGNDYCCSFRAWGRSQWRPNIRMTARTKTNWTCIYTPSLDGDGDYSGSRLFIKNDDHSRVFVCDDTGANPDEVEHNKRCELDLSKAGNIEWRGDGLPNSVTFYTTRGDSCDRISFEAALMLVDKYDATMRSDLPKVEASIIKLLPKVIDISESQKIHSSASNKRTNKWTCIYNAPPDEYDESREHLFIKNDDHSQVFVCDTICGGNPDKSEGACYIADLTKPGVFVVDEYSSPGVTFSTTNNGDYSISLKAALLLVDKYGAVIRSGLSKEEVNQLRLLTKIVDISEAWKLHPLEQLAAAGH